MYVFLGGVVLLGLFWLGRNRLPLLAAGSLVFFAMAWRAFSALYIDAKGPLFAEELNREIGPGGGWVLVASLLLTVLPVVWLWRPSILKRLFVLRSPFGVQSGSRTLGDYAFAASVAGVGALYAELAVIGVIPLLECIERTTYFIEHAGPLNGILFEHGPMVALSLGVFTVYPRLRGGQYDARHTISLIALMLYGFITGHRFSLFVVYCAFYLMPFGVLLAAKAHGRLPKMPDSGRRRGGRMSAARLLFALGLAVSVFVVAGLANSYVRVRGACESGAAPKTIVKSEGDRADYLDVWFFRRIGSLAEKLEQRLAIQQAQMWFPTWERIFVAEQWRPQAAWIAIFVSPLVPEKNSGVQYVMQAELGAEKTRELLERRHQYAAGHSEVTFELFGPWCGWLVLVAIGASFAWLLRFWAVAVWDGRFLTAFASGYIVYAYVLLIVGGMPNFVVAWTFWVKVAVAVAAWVLEKRALSKGGAVVPFFFTRTR